MNAQVHMKMMRGSSLVETMVGLLVGLLAVMAIMQVFTNFENQRRSTTAGADAQQNGLMALVQLEQDIRNAGKGFADAAALECNTIYSYQSLGGVVTSPIPAYAGGMVPVKITDGGAGSDSVAVRYGEDFLGSILATLTDTMPSSSAELDVNRTFGFADGDIILVSQGGNCTVMQVTDVQDVPLKLQHNPSAVPTATTYNPPTNFQTTNGWPGYSTGAKIINMGRLQLHTYSINANQSLQMSDDSAGAAASTLVLGKDIVSLQAQYGVSAGAGIQNVTSWVNATGSWAALDASEIKRIKAVRLVIVARSGKKEPGNVTGTCTNNAGINNGPCAWTDTAANPAPLIDLSSNPDWRKYRYRVFQTVIPIRNIIWAGV